MIVSTTPTMEGRRIARYHGIVTGQAVMGTNIFKDMFASITDIVGGRSGAYEHELRRARDLALGEMVDDAQSAGANAVVGVDLDYETVGENGTMPMVTAAGTAVTVE